MAIVMTMGYVESSHWLGKNIVWNFGKKHSKKALIIALADTI